MTRSPALRSVPARRSRTPRTCATCFRRRSEREGKQGSTAMAGLGWRCARGRGAKNVSLYLCAASAIAIAFLGRADGPVFDYARSALSDVTAPVLGQIRAPLIATQRL